MSALLNQKSSLMDETQNLILPRAGAANWLAFLGFSFGVILIGMGFTKSWTTMVACRVLLGKGMSSFPILP